MSELVTEDVFDNLIEQLRSSGTVVDIEAADLLVELKATTTRQASEIAGLRRALVLYQTTSVGKTIPSYFLSLTIS